MTKVEKFRNACNDAITVFEKIDKNGEFTQLKSDLEYCIGSYDYDGNPEGLYKYGVDALNALIDYKKQFPRKVNKKVIENLEKNLD